MTVPSVKQSRSGSSVKFVRRKGYSAINVGKLRFIGKLGPERIWTTDLRSDSGASVTICGTMNRRNTIQNIWTPYVSNAISGELFERIERIFATSQRSSANAAGKKSAAAKARKNGRGRKAVASSHARSPK